MSLPGSPRGAPRPPRGRPRLSQLAELRHQPELHHVRAPGTRERFKFKRIIFRSSLKGPFPGALISCPHPHLGDFSFWISESSLQACFFGSHSLTQSYLKFRYSRLKYLVEIQSFSQFSASSGNLSLLLNMPSKFLLLPLSDCSVQGRN
ncbi:unnamed protein product [Nyctereutes procyonoides]|uniref:(raccoon dog) hypothetical protein n=1 Tax=Nyctereutes procyonoides TaxID=34880 RepID=A0A811ZEP7_NYCPR|nr:unnamed protein product [Nyctereutes procyonoides]